MSLNEAKTIKSIMGGQHGVTSESHKQTMQAYPETPYGIATINRKHPKLKRS